MKLKVLGYETVYGTDPDELDGNVQKLAKQGYEPYGNPYVLYRLDKPVSVDFFQAMIKYNPEAN